jgi:hypothetical protein
MFNVLTACVVMAGITLAGNVPTQIDYDVQRAARNYRIQVYNTFRLNRAEYDRRQATGWQLLDAWKNSGRNDARGQELIEWFSEATEASLVDNGRALPSVPQFAHGTLSQFAGTRPDHRGMQPDHPGTQPDQHRTEQTRAPKSSAVREVGQAIVNAFGSRAAPTDFPQASGGTPAAGPAIDIDALKGQVDAFNVSILTIDQALSATSPISLDTLAQHVDTIDQLVQQQYKLIPLLAEAKLSEADRLYVGQLTSLANTISGLSERADEVRVQLEGANQDVAQLEQLDALRKRLETLTSQL